MRKRVCLLCCVFFFFIFVSFRKQSKCQYNIYYTNYTYSVELKRNRFFFFFSWMCFVALAPMLHVFRFHNLSVCVSVCVWIRKNFMNIISVSILLFAAHSFTHTQNRRRKKYKSSWIVEMTPESVFMCYLHSVQRFFSSSFSFFFVLCAS